MHFDRNALHFSPLPLKWHFLPSSAAGEWEKHRAVTGSSRVMCVRSQLLVKGLSRSSSGSLSTARAALQSSPILWSHTAVVLTGVSPSRAAQRWSPRAEGAGLGSCYFSTLCIPFAAVFLCPCCSISSVAGTEKHEHMRKVSGWVWCIHSYYLLKMRSLFSIFSLYFIYFGSVFDYETEGGEKKTTYFPAQVMFCGRGRHCSVPLHSPFIKAALPCLLGGTEHGGGTRLWSLNWCCLKEPR